MLYNCSNGKTLNMSTEYYFGLSDLELHELCNCNEAVEINDPFFESSIHKPSKAKKSIQDDSTDVDDDIDDSFFELED